MISAKTAMRYYVDKHLFNLGKVVLDVLVQDDLTDRPEREFFVWPNLCQVENIVTELLGLLRGHCLLRLGIVISFKKKSDTYDRNTYHKDVPCGEFAVLNLSKELLGGVVGVRPSNSHSSVVVERFSTAFPLEMNLHIVEAAVRANEF